MKKILGGTVAALALLATPAVAQTNQVHYNVAGAQLTNPSNILEVIAAGLAEASIAGGIGTRYTALAGSFPNSDAANTKQSIDVVFALSGTVSKDCSFYAGNNASATNISFGTIGVRTGNNENVNSAFEMVGPAVANVKTLTAGCNFNNEVEIKKQNASSGLVNAAAGGYDTDEFQANIPYSVTASWTGVTLNSVAPGSGQSLEVTTSQGSGLKKQGAWRSSMDIKFEAPAITSKGLVAGNYSDTTTLTLRAL